MPFFRDLNYDNNSSIQTVEQQKQVKIPTKAPPSTNLPVFTPSIRRPPQPIPLSAHHLSPYLNPLTTPINSYILSLRLSSPIVQKNFARLFCEMADLDQSSEEVSVDSGEGNNEVSRLDFTEDEETLIARMYNLIGQRWSLIAGRIPGRTAEEIEKYWTTRYSNSE